MGNTQAASGKRRVPVDHASFMSEPRSSTSDASPFTHQMDATAKADANRSIQDLPLTLPAQPKLVPTAIIWAHGGEHVEVEGSFDNWTSRTPLQKTGTDFTVVKLLPPGVYQYKFVVDGEWKYDPNQPAMYDEMNNVNNVIEVQEYMPENLESLVGFDLPPSPDSSYSFSRGEINSDDFHKEPPALPAHLNLTLLNVPPAKDAQAVLPRPQHVILNHTYVHRDNEAAHVMAIGATTRYKSKYITTVFYKVHGATPAPETNERQMMF